MIRSIMWRRLDLPGSEIAELDEGHTTSLSGVVLVAHAGEPCRFEYRVECDAAWRTRMARIRGYRGAERVSVDLFRSDHGAWAVNGAVVPALRGCVDVDLGFSPSTNLLPIRRLNLRIGERAAVRAAWVRFPELTVEVLEQTYARASETTYVYESAGGAFRRELTVNDAGFVVEYPGIWHAEASIAT